MTGSTSFYKHFLEKPIFEQRETWKGKLYSTKKRFGRNENYCVEDNHNYELLVRKEFSDSNFDKAVIGKISIFKAIALNFTYSQNL